MGTRNVRLSVDDANIELDYFVQGFIDHTVGGIIAGLEGTGEIRNLDIAVEKDSVSITLNGSDVPLKDFPRQIVSNTITGMVSSLKGVTNAEKVSISITR